jgi:[FeFe] hydrogenase H-cluster maturation GTPase HydF
VVVVTKEREYPAALRMLDRKPDLAVCDSQAVLDMVAHTPPDIPCTTFSILLARVKGDLSVLLQGALAIERLRAGDKVLIAEACSHHAIEGDIGRVKIPRWLRQFTGVDVIIEVCSGRDYPENLSQYQLIIQCGSCMLTRRETLARIQKAQQAGVAITNYGVAISLLQGVLDRVLSPFPGIRESWRRRTAVESGVS